MAEAKRRSREENVAYWREYLREAGPGKVLSYLLKTNQDERAELAETNDEYIGFSGLPLCVTLHLAANKDTEELLSQYGQSSFEDAVLQCRTVVLAAAIGEAALRNYLRHLLVDLFGWCDELDGMIDALTEMFKRRRKMPIDSTSECLESWWEDFPPV